MSSTTVRRWLSTVLAALLFIGGVSVCSYADDTTDKALQDQLKALMQRIDQLTKQVQELQAQQKQQQQLQQQQQQQLAQQAARPAVPPPAVTPLPPPTTPAVTPAPPSPTLAAVPLTTEPLFEAFLKSFYGTLDVSYDYTTKGIKGLVADSYSLENPNNPNSGYVNNGPKGTQIVGRVGYIPALSTNKSQIGYRFAHGIDDTGFDFLVQVETSLSITASPGLKTSYTQQSNVVQGAIGLGDTYVGVRKADWGAVKFGTTYAPYKKSTDRMNPFSGMLGDYAVIMGNTGGDNRVEFGTRLDHSMWYESPQLGMFRFNVLWSPGANRTFDNVVQSAGSPDCNGGNEPGSGNLLLNCDDGGFGDAYSADVEFEGYGFYATAAYERHRGVNRNSDGIGSNNPIYGYLVTSNSPLLDFNTFNTIVAEFPNYASVGGGTPAYLTDIADESAFKVGVQYSFPFGLRASGIYENLHRFLPQDLEFQNERQRNGLWFALSQDLTARDNVSFGWAHAGRTPGDPGGQHNFNPNNTDDTADMYTIAWKHALDKHLYWYIDSALTLNHGNAHYDLGAGGRGLTTDCHDGTNTIIVDYSSAGPTTWGGCRLMGYSTGLDYRF